MTVPDYSSVFLILPLEILLPLLGILLIRSASPTNGLIYRSFLGSIAALLYALVGAPDVALTEVLIGTLLSTLLYIVTIRSCYTVVLIQDKSSPPPKDVWDNLLNVFEELHLKATKKDFVDSSDIPLERVFAECIGRSGSPHAFIRNNTLYVESDILRQEIITSSAYKTNPFLESVVTLKPGGQA